MNRWPLAGVLLVAIFTGACAPQLGPSDDDVTLTGAALAGPTCPVVTEPPDPACQDRPVAGAEIVVQDEAGDTVAMARTAEDGSFSVLLPPGRYQLLPQPVEGLLGTAAAIEVVVPDDGVLEPVTFFYDTGIR